jgi:phenylacetate-CoA ligase
MIRQLLELRRILNTRKLSPDQLQVLREQKLRSVIRNAYEHVPYYRHLFRSNGLTPKDVRSAEDLKKVPVTTKDDLRQAGLEKITADWADLATCASVNTNGSTGKPFTIYRTQVENVTRHMLAAAALISAGLRPRDRYAGVGPEWVYKRRFYHRLGFFRSEAIPLSVRPEIQIQRLRKFQPTVLNGYPSALRVLMHHLDVPLGIVIRPRVIITGGEVFDPVVKKRVRSELDAEFFNIYAAHEFGALAYECQAHEGLHLNAGHFILECLDGDKPAEFGQAGVAVMTSLYAGAMPFIRYELGDLCALSEKRCSCGSSLPLMDHPIGRADDTVILPTGKILSAQRFGQILQKFNGIDQWRVIQESEKEFVLHLVMPNKPDQEMLEKIRSQFLDYLEEPVNLDIQLVDYMEEETRKFRSFISKVHPLH